MIWSEPCKPSENISYYDHVISITPIGTFFIEWKSWKEYDSYSITLKSLTNEEYIGNEYTLESAKKKCYDYLLETHNKLKTYLEL